ncbi:CDP-glycerol glycerophosphotransferase family protein, partial [Dellaglioa algida]
ESLMKSGKVIIERQHFKQKINKNKFEYSNIKEIPQSVDTQELLLLADVLITDYSSIYVDFILQDKPVVHYLYDKNYYINNDRGVYGKFENQVVGPIVMDIDRLKNMILSNNEDVYLPEVRKKMNIYFNEFNLKNNSEHIWKQINNED